MAAFSSLTADQQAHLRTIVDTLLRPTELASFRLLLAVQVALNEYAATTGALLAPLDPTEVIPTASGFAGATPLTAADVAAIFGDYQQIVAAFATPAIQQRIARSVGSPNLVG